MYRQNTAWLSIKVLSDYMYVSKLCYAYYLRSMGTHYLKISDISKTDVIIQNFYKTL